MVRPLVFGDVDRTAMVGQRTRIALEREKTLVLRTIKELEFDKAMGKLSDADFQEMSGRLRARATRLMRQLDAGGYRAQVEQDLAKRLGEVVAEAQAARFCPSCGTQRDADAKFCKSCGAKL
jgi:membrane protease subunit (stomatin/prohibitin family)